MKDNPRVVFDAVYKMLPALRAEVKIGKVKVSTAKLNRMMVEKAASETGIVLGADPVVDLLRSEAPAPSEVLGGLPIGDARTAAILGLAQ